MSEEPVSAAEKMAAAQLREARVDRVLQKGWVIRYDPTRDEYIAAREYVSARDVETLLDMIEGTE